MSSPLPPIILAPEATDDFAGILQHTLETWGKTQGAAYQATLDETLLNIQRYPGLGREHPELGKDLRSVSAGEHVIIYENRVDSIYVYRILHSQMDLLAYF